MKIPIRAAQNKLSGRQFHMPVLRSHRHMIENANQAPVFFYVLYMLDFFLSKLMHVRVKSYCMPININLINTEDTYKLNRKFKEVCR